MRYAQTPLHVAISHLAVAPPTHVWAVKLVNTANSKLGEGEPANAGRVRADFQYRNLNSFS